MPGSVPIVRMESGHVTWLNSAAQGATDSRPKYQRCDASLIRYTSHPPYGQFPAQLIHRPIMFEPPFSVSTRSASEDGQTGEDADQSSRAAASVLFFQQSPFGLHESRIRHSGSDVSQFCEDF